MKTLSSALILLASMGVINGNLPKPVNPVPTNVPKYQIQYKEEQSIEPTCSAFDFYFFDRDELIGIIRGESVEEVSSDPSFEEFCSHADRVAVSDSRLAMVGLPSAQNDSGGKAPSLTPPRAKEKNMSTHGKAFWWGYQVYFNHQTMTDISSYMDIGSAASGGIAALLGVASAGAGVAVGILSAFVFTNFQIMKKFDKGEGVTLTQEIWGPGIYWFNSGNCIQGE
jgi:hypothetical protein